MEITAVSPPHQKSHKNPMLKLKSIIRTLCSTVYLAIVTSLLVACGDTANPDSATATDENSAIIAEMITKVDTDLLRQRLHDLVGANPVEVEGETVTIFNRDTDETFPLDKAEAYVYEWLTAVNLDSVTYQKWDFADSDCGNGRQVVATLIGTTRPDEIVLVGAHLDSIVEEDEDGYGQWLIDKISTGADDNGSGSAALIVMADILADYAFERTIRFVAFTGEEQNICGSEFNAAQSALEDENIVAMVNMDMIGFDSDNNGALMLSIREGKEGQGDEQIAQTFVDVVELYNLDLDPEISKDGDTLSDHAEYWDVGYDALYVHEDEDDDFNDDLHSLNDDLAKINWSYFSNMTKGVLGTVAHLAFLDNQD